MINLDEDSLICDLAETYHILNYKELSPSLVATLSCGLSDNSRIKRKIADRRLTLEETLMAAMVDKLSQLLWTKTKDAQHGRNRPKSILDALEKPKEKVYKSFSSIEEFEKKRAELLKG